MNKIFHLGSVFKAVGEDNDELVIHGMASTDDKDRVGDVIVPDAWKSGLKNYKQNPIILFNHDYNRPIGRAMDVKQVGNGLELKAKISKAAGDVIQLIKDGVLSAFSVGFMVKDADYDSKADIFVIKEAELLEVSVVSVPANQAATFSVQKSFDSIEEYKEYIKSFSVNLASGQQLADKSDDALAGETPEGQKAYSQEINMDPKDLQSMIADAVKGAAKEVATQMAMQQAEQKAAEEAARKAAEEEAARKAAEKTSIVEFVRDGAAELYADLQKRFEEKEANLSKILDEFRSEMTEKSEELARVANSKRVFSDRGSEKNFFETHEADLVDAHILGQITKKGWNTRFAKELLEKAVNTNTGVAVPSVSVEAFETTVSTALERDIQLELILDPMFRKVQMNAASLVIPTMPDAGYAEFLSANAAGSGSGVAYKGSLEARGSSPGANTGINLGSKILTVEKIVAKSYIANETEEDAIMPVLPLIRESIIRSHARAIEHSILLANTSWENQAIPANYRSLIELAIADGKSTSETGSPGAGVNQITAADLLGLRKTMGKYGRRPSDVIYIVSLDAYYQLLEDPEFQNLNEVGARATKITGEIGSVFGSPVVVCDEFPTPADGTPAAVAVNPRNFVIPVLRGVTVESDYSVEDQRRVLVATQRRGFDRLFADAGQVAVRNW